MPWKAAGLTERQASAHLLSRFTYGATPGQLDAVVEMGLENWFMEQLNGQANDDAVKKALTQYDALQMTNHQVLNSFPRPNQVLKKAIDEGVISKDVKLNADSSDYKAELKEYMQAKRYRPQRELFRQFISQKILLAAYSNNQLQQVLTDFWFNHFNVSLTKNDCALFVPSYERDVIRPNATGKFNDLLLATAQSPAMLFYLDNFNSAGVNDKMQVQQARVQEKLKQMADEEMRGNEEKARLIQQLAERKKNQGLNENYAREIMELHTLGVDGGYTQADVTEAARVLTGWTVYPMEGMPGAGFAKRLIDNFGEDVLAKRGFVHNGDFLFAMNRHDSKSKKVLGTTFTAGGGYEEGVALIHLLAHHPSTAKFISKKLAIRFVSDNPPQALIDKMAATFLKSDGDIKQVLITMVAAPEFWNKDALRSKIKSPFELTISTVRALDAQIDQPFLLYQFVARMGQKLYYYQAPTGFPDKAEYWINTGALLNRMKFGLAFAAQKIPGVKFDLLELNQHHEPAGPIEALKTYSKIMMPERDVDATIKRLEPLVNDPALIEKVDSAAAKKSVAAPMITDDDEQVTIVKKSEQKLAKQLLRKKGGKDVATPTAPGNDYPLGQIVGILIGSPEFQRR